MMTSQSEEKIYPQMAPRTEEEKEAKKEYNRIAKRKSRKKLKAEAEKMEAAEAARKAKNNAKAKKSRDKKKLLKQQQAERSAQDAELESLRREVEKTRLLQELSVLQQSQQAMAPPGYIQRQPMNTNDNEGITTPVAIAAAFADSHRDKPQTALQPPQQQVQDKTTEAQHPKPKPDNGTQTSDSTGKQELDVSKRNYVFVFSIHCGQFISSS